MLTIKELLNNPKFSYLELKTSTGNIHHKITGVNRLESLDALSFIERDELVVIVGGGTMEERSLIELVTHLIEQIKISAIVINIDGTIMSLPKKIIEVGNKYGVAIFIMPWSIRVADFTHNLTKMLIKTQEQRVIFDKFLSELAFQQSFVQTPPLLILEQLDAQLYDKYSIIMIKALTEKKGHSTENDYYTFKSIIDDKYHSSISSKTKDLFIFIVKDNDDSEVTYQAFITASTQLLKKKINRYTLSKGRSYELEMIHLSYQEALKVSLINQNRFKQDFFSYNDLGVYKLLLEIDNKTMLQTFHEDVLGSLIEYDHRNKQNFHGFLREFFQSNGKITVLSKKLFLHRNTILYRLERISEITKLDVRHFPDFTYLSLALAIEDLPGLDLPLIKYKKSDLAQ